MKTIYSIDYNVYIFYVLVCVYQTNIFSDEGHLCEMSPYSLTGKEFKIPTIEIIVKD